MSVCVVLSYVAVKSEWQKFRKVSLTSSLFYSSGFYASRNINLSEFYCFLYVCALALIWWAHAIYHILLRWGISRSGEFYSATYFSLLDIILRCHGQVGWAVPIKYDIYLEIIVSLSLSSSWYWYVWCTRKLKAELWESMILLQIHGWMVHAR